MPSIDRRFADLWQIVGEQLPRAPEPWDQKGAKREWEKNMIMWRFRLEAFGIRRNCAPIKGCDA